VTVLPHSSRIQPLSFLAVSARALPNNYKATTTRHNYSRWRRPRNLKTKTSVFENYLFQVQTPSFEKVEAKFIVKVILCSVV